MPRTDAFASRLLAWFDHHGRKDLPWQRNPTPYRVWVSEVMLQQTQVTTVIPYYQRFIGRFGSVAKLAAAASDEVLAHWSGLGYYSRARNLHKAAGIVVSEFRGRMPTDVEALVGLPGIGRSTAGAIRSLSGKGRAVILDGNVKRVLTRYHAITGWPGLREVENRLWELAEGHTPHGRVAEYNQAIMDLGATVCLRRRPLCMACPEAKDCSAFAAGESECYPEPKPRKPKPLRHTTLLVLRREDGAVLLERRPSTGIWGGLHSLPECPDVAADCIEGYLERYGLRVLRQQALCGFRHAFSHFSLDIEPICLHVREQGPARVMEPAGGLWYKSDTFNQLGLPAPIRRILGGLGDHDPGVTE